jgi:hypothetical protein
VDSVRQVFDWRTAPVKRIDRMEMGMHSGKTQDKPLLAYAFPAPAEGASGAGAPAPAPAGGGAAGPAPAADATENGLIRSRYVEITPQLRRMPVALSLIVDQGNIQDVLAAIGNSRLRVQVTQALWSKFSGDIKPAITEAGPAGGEERPAARGKGGSKPPAPTGREQRPAGKLGGMAGPMGGGGKPPTPPPSGATGGTPVAARSALLADDQDFELVELNVYGIATLYERYPPKSAAGATTEAAPAGAEVKK